MISEGSCDTEDVDITEINYILKYIKIANTYFTITVTTFHNIPVLLYFYQMNAALASTTVFF